ncbi:serine protease [Linnemannia schmuckeri]|uniref:Serine protease n=1 Tax=Linnemannia schmuckeri TaxID=64567 RepID=A0A9P5V7T2_9FUNG|nr:serine protease [Linnemannia schmuckeri]
MFLATASFSILMASQALATTVHSQTDDIAPLIPPDAAATVFPDSYIVVFKDGFKSSNFSSKGKQANPAQQSHDNNKAALWDEIIKGTKHSIDLGSFQAVAGRFHAEALAEIRQHPAVAFVERDTVGYRLNPSSSLSKTREYRPWGLAPSSIASSSPTAAVSVAAAQTTSSDSRSARIYLYDAQEGDGEGITISATDADMTLVLQDVPKSDGQGLKADDDAASVPDLSTSASTNEKDALATVTTTQTSSCTLVFKLVEETQLEPVSTLRSSGDGTVSDFVAVIDYIVRNQLKRKDGCIADEKVGHSESVLSVPFAFTNSRSMVLAATKAFDSGLHLALESGVMVTSQPSNITLEQL